jgi:MSHA pilin protein MshA
MKVLNSVTSKKQAGFTLIELVIVIVILGILAATAAPKFINLSSDANASARAGVVGAVRSAMALGHTKALLAGVVDGEVTIAGKIVNIAKSYPSVEADGDGSTADGTAALAYNFAYLLDVDKLATNAEKANSGPMTITIATDCTVTITDTGDGNIPPVIGGVETGCPSS